jgi:hypothetical protein
MHFYDENKKQIFLFDDTSFEPASKNFDNLATLCPQFMEKRIKGIRWLLC